MKGTNMKQLKYILPLLLTIITLAIYNPIETQASTTNYNITFTNNSRWIGTGSQSLSSWSRTNLITILNNSIIINGNYTNITFYDNNNNQIGLTIGSIPSQPENTSISQTTPQGNISNLIPNGAVYFGITAAGDNSSVWSPNNITFTSFQTVTVSYSTPVITPISVSLPPTPFIYLEPYGLSYNGYDLWRIAQVHIPNINTLTSALLWSTNSFVDIDNYQFTTPADGLYQGTGVPGTIQEQQIGQLTPNTTYYYRTYVEINGNYYYSSTGSVTTPNITNHTIPTPTYSITPNLAATITFPAVTQGNIGQIYDRGWLWTDDGTTPTLTNTLSHSPYSQTIGVNNEFEIFPVLDYSTTYKYRQYVRDGINTNSTTYYSDVLTFTTPNQTFNVEFRDYDETLISTVTVEQGESVTNLPPNPTRTGYTFNSWQPPVTNIQGNLVTYATYDQNSYLVTFISSGVLVGQQNVLHGSGLDTTNIPIPTLQGFIFQHYTLFDNVYNINNFVIFPMELIAVFEAIPTYTITWRDPAFNTLKIETVNSGLIGTPPNYVPNSGFTLVGWTPDITQPVTQNIQYIAVVEQIPITPPSGTVNATGLTDLFAGVFGAIVGSLMILGTIDLFGLQLSSLLWLFFAGTGFMMVWKVIRG
jgi:hypothetical protein